MSAFPKVFEGHFLSSLVLGDHNVYVECQRNGGRNSLVRNGKDLGRHGPGLFPAINDFLIIALRKERRCCQPGMTAG